MATVTPASWAHSLLSALSLPITTQNLKILVGWAAAEGGAGPQFGVAGNTANFNPLNTTQTEPGSSSVNSVGVQSYLSWSQGLTATVQTLNNGHYPQILALLASGSASSATAAATIDSSVWGTTGLSAAMIDGAQVSGGTPVPGGTTGTPNQTQASPWTVGSTSNPDQDYWTTINQYCQNAQLYCFSNGESLYVADGIKLMGQNPRAFVVRWGPSIVDADCTWDNSSFSYTTTHPARGKVQRQAALARVTSPTGVTLRLICPIDEFRAGETVYLQGWGPADGPWLIGTTTRSVYEIFTELQLVQAMQPINAVTGTPFPGTTATGAPTGPLTPGTYTNPFAKATGLVPGRTDDGVDFSMNVGSPILAIGNSKVVGPPAGSANATNWYAGQPIMVLQFLDGPRAFQYYYFAEQIDNLAPLGSLVKAGQQICTYAPSGTAIETGFAASPDGTTLAQSHGHGGEVPAPEGTDYRNFLQGLGVFGGTGFTG